MATATDSANDLFVHPDARCESETVGPGTRIWAFAHVMAGARVGAQCNICDHVFIESGAVVGNRVTVKNRALIFEGVTLADDVFVGPGAIFTNDRYGIDHLSYRLQVWSAGLGREFRLGPRNRLDLSLNHLWLAGGGMLDWKKRVWTMPPFFCI